MADIDPGPLIVIKGIPFLVIVLISASALFALSPDCLTAALCRCSHALAKAL